MTSSLIRRARNTPRVQLRGARLFWEPSKSLRRLGVRGAALGPLTVDTLNRADELNAAADAQLAGGAGRSAAPVTLGEVIDRYLASCAYVTALRASTRRHYARHLARIRADLGALRTELVTPARVRVWHRDLAAASPRDAFNHLATLRAFFAWAIAEGLARTNPASALRVPRPVSRRRVGSREEIWAMVRAADALGRPSIALAALLITATMQRLGDTLALTREQVQGGALYLAQSKTGTELNFRLHPVVAERLGEITGSGPLIVSETTGQAYGERGFERAWDLVRAEAAKATPSLTGADPAVRDPTHKGPLSASDLRRTGMVWAAQSGAGIPDICSVSGHSLRRGMDILETYLPRQRMLADRAIARLDMLRPPNPDNSREGGGDSVTI